MAYTISVDPDGRHILSVAPDGRVILDAERYDDEDPGAPSEPCLLLVSRAVYHAAIDAWLDGKAIYGRYGQFAGVGCIYFLGYSKEPGQYWRRGDDDKSVAVDAYSVETFAVDMEHG
jgi:hypothetical protein